MPSFPHPHSVNVDMTFKISPKLRLDVLINYVPIKKKACMLLSGMFCSKLKFFQAIYILYRGSYKMLHNYFILNFKCYKMESLKREKPRLSRRVLPLSRINHYPRH